MTSINHTPSLFGWIALQLSSVRVTRAPTPRYTAADMAAVVAGSGSPAGG